MTHSTVTSNRKTSLRLGMGVESADIGRVEALFAGKRLDEAKAGAASMGFAACGGFSFWGSAVAVAATCGVNPLRTLSAMSGAENMVIGPPVANANPLAYSKVFFKPIDFRIG